MNATPARAPGVKEKRKKKKIIIIIISEAKGKKKKKFGERKRSIKILKPVHQ